MENIEFRKIKEGEYDDFLNIAILSYSKKTDEKLIVLKKHTSKESSYNYGLFLDNKIIGVLTVSITDIDFISGNSISVFNLAIRGDLKGKGYGSRMLGFLFAEITKTFAVNLVFLYTSKAKDFYIKNGFEIIGSVKMGYSERFYLFKRLSE